VRLGDHYSTLNVRGASATRALGINATGKVVGNYVVGGQTHAFLATPEE
jgi:probable HAF family extracellular repeat protein